MFKRTFILHFLFTVSKRFSSFLIRTTIILGLYKQISDIFANASISMWKKHEEWIRRKVTTDDGEEKWKDAWSKVAIAERKYEREISKSADMTLGNGCGVR